MGANGWCHRFLVRVRVLRRLVGSFDGDVSGGVVVIVVWWIVCDCYVYLELAFLGPWCF